MLMFIPEMCRAAAKGSFLDARDAPNFVITSGTMDGSLFHTSLPYFAAMPGHDSAGMMSLPDDCSCWCEDGRVAGVANDNPNQMYIATL